MHQTCTIEAPKSEPLPPISKSLLRRGRRNQSLDVLRFVAIMLVLGSHVPYYRLWGFCGWMGVDLFFVLSGFLVSGLLFTEFKATGSIDIRRFIVRRGLKIWPAFYFLLAITALLFAGGRGHFPTEGLLVNALFVSNYFTPPSPLHLGQLGHTWSLAVEEHFYLILPVLLIALISLGKKSRDPFRPIPFLFAAFAAICMGFRYFAPPRPIVTPTHMRFDSLFAGVTLSYIYHFRREWFRRLQVNYALGAAFLFCLPAFFLQPSNRWMATLGLSGLFIGFSFLLAWSIDRQSTGVLLKHAASIGSHSYSIYLWHWILALLVTSDTLGAPATAARFWIYVVTSISFGIAMGAIIEFPALSIRNRIFPATVAISPVR